MENVVMITFDVEAQAYQAFSQLKNDSVNSAYTILQMAVIKNGDGKDRPRPHGFDSGIDSHPTTPGPAWPYRQRRGHPRWPARRAARRQHRAAHGQHHGRQ